MDAGRIWAARLSGEKEGNKAPAPPWLRRQHLCLEKWGDKQQAPVKEQLDPQLCPAKSLEK